LGLSQTRMTMKLGTGELAYHRISEFEKGRRWPDLKTVLAYARATSIPMEYLADDEVSMDAFKNHLAQSNRRVT
jgi:transcriptional regulator with XRE-family HTH domain